jgi:polysaccharide deacetylase family protein (PEP-CTERM system associated)
MSKDISRTCNFLTLDIEEWYRVNYEGIDIKKCRELPSNLESTVDSLIDLCAAHNVKTTCFILGELAEKNPEVVRKLFNAGHEIASHGYGHQLVYAMKPRDFRADLLKSTHILANITGEQVLGYRAPSFSVDEGSLDWFYTILAEAGFKYSSSVFPVKTFLYGIDNFSEKMHYPEIKGCKYGILEIPVPTVNIFGKKIGLYIRLFPAWFIINLIEKRNNAGKSVILYLHPREIDTDQPRLKLPFFTSLLHYWGVRGCESKVSDVLRACGPGFLRMRDIVSDEL